MNEATAELNGNKLVKDEHVFINGKGCYFANREIARKYGVGPNASGTWVEVIKAFGRTWFQIGQNNVWD